MKFDEADISLHGGKGGHPDQVRALQEGIGDGAPVGSPWWLFLSKQGYVNLGCEADYRPGLGCNGVHTTAERIKSDPEEVRAIVRSYIKAVRYCRENVEGTIELMLRYAKDWGVDSPETAREAYKWLAPCWSETIDPQVSSGSSTMLQKSIRRQRAGLTRYWTRGFTRRRSRRSVGHRYMSS